MSLIKFHYRVYLITVRHANLRDIVGYENRHRIFQIISTFSEYDGTKVSRLYQSVEFLDLLSPKIEPMLRLTATFADKICRQLTWHAILINGEKRSKGFPLPFKQLK